MVNYDKNAIKRSGLTIYDHIPAERPDLYIASKKLEWEILKESLVGLISLRRSCVTDQIKSLC